MPIIDSLQWDGSQASADAIGVWSTRPTYKQDDVLRFDSATGPVYALPGDWFVLREDGIVYLCTEDLYDLLT